MAAREQDAPRLLRGRSDNWLRALRRVRLRAPSWEARKDLRHLRARNLVGRRARKLLHSEMRGDGSARAG